MPSEESKIIRAAFRNEAEDLNVPIETQRRAWEEAVAQAPLPPGVNIQTMLADDIPCEKISYADSATDKLILHLHGGGFSAGSCKTHRELAARLALATGIPVLLVDYRLAPEHPFPAALDDSTRVYRWLLRTGFQPEKITVCGDSAGGGLALSTLLALRQHGQPLPGNLVLLSPWTDLTMSGESIQSRAKLAPFGSKEGLLAAAKLYIGEANPANPLISPVFADLRGLPPMLIQVGDHELILSDSTRLAEQVGVQVQLEIWPEMWHVWQAWAASLPEGQAALEQIGTYLHKQSLINH